MVYVDQILLLTLILGMRFKVFGKSAMLGLFTQPPTPSFYPESDLHHSYDTYCHQSAVRPPPPPILIGFKIADSLKTLCPIP